MIFFYKTYRYSVGATVLSAVSSAMSVMMVIGGIACFGSDQIVVGILLIVAGAACFWFLSRKLPDKVAVKSGVKNIHTKPNYAFLFCQEHPEFYEQLAAEIPKFGEKYMRDPATGKVVKRKKVK